MTASPDDRPPRRRTREEYEQGLPDHHDPTAGFAGAAPARSALTLRLFLAVFGLVVCGVGGVIALGTTLPAWFGIALLVLAAIALVDIGVIIRRKARGEPG
jgi:Family of unknown function (DUF6343)